MGLPASPFAVIANLTVVDPAGDGYLAAYPGGMPWSGTSNVNYARGQTVANFALIKVNRPAGTITLRANVSTHVLIDVMGYLDQSGAEMPEIAPVMNPVRLLDTRQPGHQRPTAGSTTTVNVTDAKSGPHPVLVNPDQLNGAVVNVTVVNASRAGYASVFTGNGATPRTSNVNYPAGGTAAVTTFTGLTASSLLSVYQSADADIIVDLVGYLTLRWLQSPVWHQADPDSDLDVSDNGMVAVYTEEVNGATRLMAMDRHDNSNSQIWIGNSRELLGRHPRVDESGLLMVFETDVSYDPQDGDTTSDVYLFNRWTRELRLLSGGSDPGTGHTGPAISADGSTFAWTSTAADGSGSLVRLRGNERTVVDTWNAGAGTTDLTSLTRDGSTVAWSLGQCRTASADAGVFVRTASAAAKTRVDRTASGVPDAAGCSPRISANGRVTFESKAGNLVPGGTSTGRHLYTAPAQGPLHLAARTYDGRPAVVDNWDIKGDVVVFSTATNFYPGADAESDFDLFTLNQT